MSKQSQLVVVEQKTVAFYDDDIIAVQTESGDVYVPIRPICDLLGIAWSAQRLRINRDPVLSEDLIPVIVTITGPNHGKPQTVDMMSLPLKRLAGFLFGIQSRRVKEDIRDRLIRYQRECYDVLSAAFTTGRLTFHNDIMNADSAAARAYQIATALQDLARYQYLMEQRIDSAETKLATHDSLLTNYNERIESLELQLASPAHHVSDAQASQLSQAVKALALELGKRSGRNEYGGVYGELYRRFEVTSYKRLPANQFDEAMEFLRQWWQTITSTDNVPF